MRMFCVPVCTEYAYPVYMYTPIHVYTCIHAYIQYTLLALQLYMTTCIPDVCACVYMNSHTSLYHACPRNMHTIIYMCI